MEALSTPKIFQSPNGQNPISIWFIVCLVLAFLLIKGCGYYKDSQYKLKEVAAMYDAVNDSIHRYKTKQGQDSVEKKLLYGSLEALNALSLEKGSEIEKLRKLVNKNTISASTVRTETHGVMTSKTEAVRDTICDSTCYPTYYTSYNNKWENVTVLASKDSVKVDYTVFNDFSMTQEMRKEGKWYNPKYVPYVTIKNNNPHTTTTNLQSFAVEPPKQKKGLWLIYGTIAGVIGGVLIAK